MRQMDLLCIRYGKYKLVHDSQSNNQHQFHIFLGMGLYIYYECMFYQLDNRCSKSVHIHNEIVFLVIGLIFSG